MLVPRSFVLVGVLLLVSGCLGGNISGPRERSPYVSLNAGEVGLSSLREMLLHQHRPFTQEEIEKRFINEVHDEADAPLVPINEWNFLLIDIAIVSQEVVFAVNLEHQVLVSRDQLQSFQPIDSIPTSDRVFEIATSPIDSDVMYLSGIEHSWISEDGGSTFQQVSSQILYDISFHPSEGRWFIGRSPNISGGLFATKDLGNSWTLLAGRVIKQLDWCRAGTGDLPEERICVISSESEGDRFKYTNDFGRTWVTPLQSDASYFYVLDRYITLVTSRWGEVSFYVSADDGKVFRKSTFPDGVDFGVVTPSQFLEDDNGVIWIMAHRSDEDLNSAGHTKGDLYNSDSDGFIFSKVLSDVHSLKGLWDVHLMESMEGTLFANQVKSLDPLQITTVITFDNGDTWNSIHAPEGMECPGCHLQLNGITRTANQAVNTTIRDHVATTASAVGMVLATGNVGEYLDWDSSMTSSFVSRDGGISFRLLLDKSTVFEYADHGGILVFGNNVDYIDHLHYSLNGGVDIEIAPLGFEIKLIDLYTISPRSERLLLFGYRPGEDKYKIFSADFSQLHERECVEDDYEVWEPHNGVDGPECVLGRDIFYRRRKQHAKCYSSDSLDVIVNKTNCECTEDDFECELGYDRTVRTNKCVTTMSEQELFQKLVIEPCQNGAKYYTSPTGYRKLPGDSCVGGRQDEFIYTTRKACSVYLNDAPVFEITRSWFIMLVIIIVLVLAVAALAGYIIAVRTESVRHRFPWLPAPEWVTAGYSNTLIDDLELGPEFGDDLGISLELSGDESSDSEEL